MAAAAEATEASATNLEKQKEMMHMTYQEVPGAFLEDEEETKKDRQTEK